MLAVLRSCSQQQSGITWLNSFPRIVPMYVMRDSSEYMVYLFSWALFGALLLAVLKAIFLARAAASVSPIIARCRKRFLLLRLIVLFSPPNRNYSPASSLFSSPSSPHLLSYVRHSTPCYLPYRDGRCSQLAVCYPCRNTECERNRVFIACFHLSLQCGLYVSSRFSIDARRCKA